MCATTRPAEQRLFLKASMLFAAWDRAGLECLLCDSARPLDVRCAAARSCVQTWAGAQPARCGDRSGQCADLLAPGNEGSVRDLYRIAQAFVETFIASYPKAPQVIVLDMDHSEDATHGQQEFAFYNHHYGTHCYLPLFLFEGLSGKFITAVLRPGKRPTGAENALILSRVFKRLRAEWPQTCIILRGDGHFSNPELMALAMADPLTDFIFGLAGKRALTPRAEPLLPDTRKLHALRTEVLVGTELANAEPATVIIKLFELAMRVVQYKDRVRLQLPSSCPAKALLQHVTETLFRAPPWPAPT